MRLYERLIEEARREGISYSPPPITRAKKRRRSPKEKAQIEILEMWSRQGVTSAFEGMYFKTLQKRYPAQFDCLMAERWWRERLSQAR